MTQLTCSVCGTPAHTAAPQNAVGTPCPRPGCAGTLECRRERKMVCVETTYRSGNRSRIRYVGTPEELGELVTRALKGNVQRLHITREQPPYEATQAMREHAALAEAAP